MSATACPVIESPPTCPIAPPRPIRLRVDVTAEDIGPGERWCKVRCPIALAAIRSAGRLGRLDHVAVLEAEMRVRVDGVSYRGRLPAAAIRFARRFDSRRPELVPFAFDVELSPIHALSPERRELAAAHADWALRVIARVVGRHPRLRADLESAALVGLCQAAAAYDPDLGHEFRTFAKSRLFGAVVDEMRRSTPGYRHRNTAPPTIVPLDGDPVADGRDPVGWEIEYHDGVGALAGRLGGTTKRAVFLARHTRADCRRWADAGRVAGVKTARACQAVQEAYRELREKIHAGS
jgi:hypothetical protein